MRFFFTKPQISGPKTNIEILDLKIVAQGNEQILTWDMPISLSECHPDYNINLETDFGRFIMRTGENRFRVPKKKYCYALFATVQPIINDVKGSIKATKRIVLGSRVFVTICISRL